MKSPIVDQAPANNAAALLRSIAGVSQNMATSLAAGKDVDYDALIASLDQIEHALARVSNEVYGAIMGPGPDFVMTPRED